MLYEPDNWILLKISEEDTFFYKVLAGWSSGYLHGSSWRMNSGVSKVEENGDFYLFYGETGSVYKCHKETESLKMNIAGIYKQLQDKYGDLVSRIDYVDFKKET